LNLYLACNLLLESERRRNAKTPWCVSGSWFWDFRLNSIVHICTSKQKNSMLHFHSTHPLPCIQSQNKTKNSQWDGTNEDDNSTRPLNPFTLIEV
jgi:hypothetical protein